MSIVAPFGSAPVGWQTTKFRYVFGERTAVNGPSPHGEMLSVSGYRGIETKQYSDEGQKRSESELENYRVVKAGDLVINTMWLNHSGLGMSRFDGHVSPAYRVYWVLKPQSSNPSYLHYLLRSSVYVASYTKYLTGIRPNSLQLPRELLMEWPILQPPPKVQESIVVFLDRETAQIDELIAKQEQLANALGERLKAYWNELALSLAGRFGTIRMGRVIESIVDGPFGSSLTSAHYSAEGTRVVRLGNLGNYEFLDHDAAYIPHEYAEQLSSHRLESGDVVVAGLGDDSKPLGRAAVIPHGFGPGIVKADCYRVRPRPNVSADYLAWLLSSPFAGEQFSYLGRGSTRLRLNTTSVQEVRIPLPPIVEQEALLAEFNAVRASHRNLTNKATEMIALLKERRQALISAAVTGKIDLTGKV